MSDLRQVEETFLDALAHAPETRIAFIRGRCRDDAAVLQEVIHMLQAHEAAAEFLEQPAVEAHASLLVGSENGELQAGEVLGPYRISALLGEGGMGKVYLAEDTELGRKVAIKLIKHGISTRDLIRHLRREARILARLSHPNIARLFGVAVTPLGLPYFVMEYIEGERLDDYCNSRNLPANERLALFRQVCSAVAYAHQHLVIHRDLKPANIRVTPERDAKLLDFGIAKVLDHGASDVADLTFTSERAMTPDYASPEQLRGEPMSTASDIYSLGVLLYELLTGTRPYKCTTKSPDERIRMIAEQAPVRPSAVAGDRNKLRRGDLDNIVLMAMRSEPARRYASVGQLEEDIGRYLVGLPVLARMDSLKYRAGKFVGRNKISVAAAAAIFMIGSAGVIATLREGRIAVQERDRARIAQTTAERLNQFLQGMLAGADPDRLGRDVKVVQVLDAAAAKLDEELQTEPKVLAQAHLTIARAYLQLRIPDRAESHARAALAIDERLLGGSDLATAQAMSFLGRALKAFHRVDEAEAFLRRAWAVERNNPSTDGNELGATLTDLGAVMISVNRAAEARPLVEESLALSRKLHGDKSVEVADALNNLGNLRRELHESAGAETAYREAVAIHRSLEPTRITFLNALDNLCVLLFREGRVDEVETLLHEGEAFCRKSMGENTPSYGFVLGRLGFIDFVKQQYAEAIPKLQRCLESVGLVYPKTDTDMLLTKVALGLSLTREGRAEVAERYLREALDEGRETSRTDLAPIGNLEGALGECLLAQSRYADAEPFLRVSYDELRVRAGYADVKTMEIREQLQRINTSRP